MSTIVPEHLIQRMAQSAHADVDVRVIAERVEDWNRRGGVKNPPGVFVSMVRKESRQRREADLLRDADRGEAQERQARFFVEVLRLAVTQQLTPAAVAEVLAGAGAMGLAKASPRVIEQLRRFGQEWPK